MIINKNRNTNNRVGLGFVLHIANQNALVLDSIFNNNVSQKISFKSYIVKKTGMLIHVMLLE